MTQTHLRWIRMALPVDDNWKNFLIREVHPLLESADNTGAINQWYFNLAYRRGPLLDVFIEADSTAVHTILRPMLQERFGQLKPNPHPSALLREISPQFETVPADIEEDCLTDLHVVSTQLMANHGQHCPNSQAKCSAEVTAALYGVKRGQDWVSAFAKTQLGIWLDQYLHNRYTSRQIGERQNQEVELLAFLRQQTLIEQEVFRHPQKTAWIEGFQAISMLFDGETHIANALNEHIKRYNLSPFQVGQLWLGNVGRENCQFAATPSTKSASLGFIQH